ncbi:MAG: uridine kinase [candidate division KSB1 bacterium]|nr:uridine kinase [candidate division KSB1 bacterium]MDZ7293807.1 uridine kinase [candidate division KSB1 bacterium]MDZ7378112.1 uridine kinase [candidate division KSB1 bacterium]MDZ7391408.1 uridine kinase [candidate division KSB1 bacterium]
MTARTQRPVVVAIAGGSGSGKSYLAQRLMERLGRQRCVLIEQDSYYADLSALPLAERARRNFDHPDALDFDLLVQHLRQLINGRSIAKPVYDFAQHTRRPETVMVAPAEVIIVEGILVLHDARVRRLCDLCVFVDAPVEVRLQRRLARDVAERGRTAESVHRQFTESVLPMHNEFVEPSRHFADMVLSGCGDEQGLSALEQRIREELGRTQPSASKE